MQQKYKDKAEEPGRKVVFTVRVKKFSSDGRNDIYIVVMFSYSSNHIQMPSAPFLNIHVFL